MKRRIFSWMFEHRWSLFRKFVQVSVVCFVAYAAINVWWRNYKLAHNNERIVGLILGDHWAFLYKINEKLLELFGEPYEVSAQIVGLPWAGKILGIPTADPTMALSFVIQHGFLPLGVVLGLLLPIGLVLVFGKIYCSHLCPMRLSFEFGQVLRLGLLRLGVPLPRFVSDVRLGGFVLIGSLVVALLGGAAIWLFWLPYYALSAGIFLAITAGAAGGVGFIVLFWLLVDLFLAPGYFCHNLCPTGFILEQLGRRSRFRVRTMASRPACPESCRVCQVVCPYDLLPKEERHHNPCDRCGVCVTACPQKRLKRSFGPLTVVLLGLLMMPTAATAHHNKGLPHYGYFENYPQVPVNEYVEIHGDWEIGATIFNFQGLDRRTADTPNDVKIYVYVFDLKTGFNYSGPVTFELLLDEQVVASWQRGKPDEETVYVSRETLPESGAYQVAAEIVSDVRTGEKTKLTIEFDIDIAGEGVPIGAILFGLLAAGLLGGLALFGYRKRLQISYRDVGGSS